MLRRIPVLLSFLLTVIFVDPVAAEIDSSFLTPHYQKRLSTFVLEPKADAPIVFLGNSLTEGFDLKMYFPDHYILNRGIVGDNTFGFLHRLKEITDRKPKQIFILGGVNDIASDIPLEVYLDNYQKVIREIQLSSAQSKIYIQSLLPANFNKMKFKRMTGKQGRIEAFNKELEAMAIRLKIEYIDLYPSFLNEEQTELDPAFTNDGLHLLPVAYDRLAQLIKFYIQ